MIDSHAHLTYDDSDAEKVISDMKKDGLNGIVAVGYDMLSSRKSVELAQKNDGVFAAVGVHPSDIEGFREEWLDELLSLSKNDKTVAIGEIGLDYHYGEDREMQKKWLCAQLEVVKAADLPVVIHLRDAYEDMLKLISENLSLLPRRGVMHCFSGSRETALKYVDMGFYISFSGVITFKNAYKFSEIIPAVPKDRILVETDCPYLTPEPFRGKPNSPKLVRHTLTKISEYLGMEFCDAERLTMQNTLNIFTKMRGKLI